MEKGGRGEFAKKMGKEYAYELAGPRMAAMEEPCHKGRYGSSFSSAPAHPKQPKEDDEPRARKEKAEKIPGFPDSRQEKNFGHKTILLCKMSKFWATICSWVFSKFWLCREKVMKAAAKSSCHLI